MSKLNALGRSVIRMVDNVNKIITAVCVILLTIQTCLIIVMVFGRYLFNHVPQGTEQAALFCMVWFALLSISLSVRDDSHVKMEVLSIFIKKEEHLVWFKYFGAFMTFVFAILVIIFGNEIVALTAPVKMSAFRISTGLLYLAAPVGAFCMVINCLAFVLELAFSRKDARNDN